MPSRVKGTNTITNNYFGQKNESNNNGCHENHHGSRKCIGKSGIGKKIEGEGEYTRHNGIVDGQGNETRIIQGDDFDFTSVKREEGAKCQYDGLVGQNNETPAIAVVTAAAKIELLCAASRLNKNKGNKITHRFQLIVLTVGGK